MYAQAYAEPHFEYPPVGLTVHLVSEEIDRGRILAQTKVPVMPDDDADTLAARVLVQEHALYWKTIKEYAESLGLH